MLFEILMIMYIFGIAYAGYYVDEHGLAGK